MPYKYIGRRTDFKGKTLWEIVGNLKNFGVGRIVKRNMFERYPEPSYFKILKVEPLACPEVQTLDDQRKVRVLVEKTFRGKTITKPITLESASYKADYRLIPKHEEAQILNKIKEANEIPIFPKTTEFPPLLRELLKRDMNSNGEEVKEPILDIVYNKKNDGKYRVAQEGEKPTVELDVGITKTPYPNLYKNITL